MFSITFKYGCMESLNSCFLIEIEMELGSIDKQQDVVELDSEDSIGE